MHQKTPQATTAETASSIFCFATSENGRASSGSNDSTAPNETDIALLEQVEEGDTSPFVPAGDRSDQP